MSTKLAKRSDFLGTGPVRYHIESGPGGLMKAKLMVDYADAPVPEHYYVADYFEVVNLDPQVLFIFGKLTYPGQNVLRNKLEIYFPALVFITQFWHSRREFHKTLRAFVSQAGYEPVRPGNFSGAVEKVQTIHSNNALMILAGGECMLDFFYISPRDLALKTPKGQNITLEPLVRVIASPNLILGFLDACEPIAELLQPKFGEQEEAHEIVES